MRFLGKQSDIKKDSFQPYLIQRICKVLSILTKTKKHIDWCLVCICLHYMICIYIYIYIYIYIRGDMVHVFVPNRHGTGISVRCMRPYDEYRQFTPIQKGALAVMQRCLKTASASRRTVTMCWFWTRLSHGLTKASHTDWQELCLCILHLSSGTNPNSP